MGLFKRKKKVENTTPDFSKYKIKINGKVMCAYEALTGKPFLAIKTEDEIKHLFYCSLVLNNEEFSTMDYTVFEYLIADKSVMEWMTMEYLNIGSYLSQFSVTVGDNVEKGENGEDEPIFWMIEAISGLIVKMGIDPTYVMYNMEEWEITYYYRMMQNVDRERLTEERLWTYLQILPHVGKKLEGPEKLLPFPWENKNKKAEKELENNSKAAFAFLTNKKKDGEGGLDNNPEQGGVDGGEQLAVTDGQGGPNSDGN